MAESRREGWRTMLAEEHIGDYLTCNQLMEYRAGSVQVIMLRGSLDTAVSYLGRRQVPFAHVGSTSSVLVPSEVAPQLKLCFGGQRVSVRRGYDNKIFY